jgi:diguanylate cyclase (GGDEF)-like protein
MKPYELEARRSESFFLELITPLLNGEKALQTFEALHRRKNGTLYNVHINLQLMEVEGVEKFVAIVNDITEQKKVFQEKEHYYDLSIHDHLTNIFNRQMFDELFKIEVEQSRRYNSDMSLILMDIDFFKTVNDTLGHQSGDNVIKIISANVKSLLRDSDIFARWGGEEFVILMPHADISMAVEKAEQLRKSIENLKIDTVGSVTCSFGVAQLKDSENANELFNHVDEALYKSKHNGRNRVETAD